jgi:hypothetical protein
MRSVAQRMTPVPESPETRGEVTPAPSPTQQALTVVWVYDGPVCMTIVDSPAPAAHGGVCHCPACHGAMFDDWDGHFY